MVLVHNVDCWNPLPPHKLWSKGKLQEHFGKHGSEFGAKSAKEYSELALKFGQRTDEGVLKGGVGDFIYKFEPKTNTVFVGTSSGRVKTFYKWDGRSDAVIDYFRGTGAFQ